MRHLFTATFFVVFFTAILLLFDSIFFHPDKIATIVSVTCLSLCVATLLWSNDNKLNES